MERRPSEIITEFLTFLESSRNEYESAYEDVGKEDSRVQTFLHDMEFAKDKGERSRVQTFLHDMEFAKDKGERSRIATRLQQSRRTRRKAKDRAKLYEHIHNFYADRQNQGFLKALRRLQNEQASEEKYLFGPREFKKRVD